MVNPHRDLQAAVDALVINNGNKAKTAASLGIAVSTLKGRLVQAQTVGITPLVTPPEAQGQMEKLKLQYEDKLRALESEVKNRTREELTSEAVRKYFLGLAEATPEPPKWVVKASEARRGPGVPTVFMSDFHWGEVVNPVEVEGINEFNPTIASRRFKTLVDKTVHLAKDHMVNPEYPGIVVVLGGDMVSGNIHQELAETNEGQTMQHVFDLFQHLASGLDHLANQFGRVFVPCTFGNHGRNTQKPRHKSAAYTSFDWQLSCMLENHFKASKDDRVQFSIPASPDTSYNLMGHDYLLTHGDRMGVKGGDGQLGALGPISRGVQRIKKAYATLGQNVDTVLMGHYHQNVRLPDAIVNNTLKGYDEYAMSNRFAPSPANQAIWWTHPDYGITFESKIFVDEPEAKLEPDAWVKWRK